MAENVHLVSIYTHKYFGLQTCSSLAVPENLVVFILQGLYIHHFVIYFHCTFR